MIDLKFTIMADLLNKAGIYFDEVDKICILEPEVSKLTSDLKDECQVYMEKINAFQEIANRFINLVEELGKEVEKQKFKAIGARNVLQGMEIAKEKSQQQLQMTISERTVQLERLKVEYNSLQKTEMEQNEILNQLMHY